MPDGAKSVHLCLWKKKQSFPVCSSEAAYFLRATKYGRTWKATFRDVPRGSYAISGFADMDGDGELDRNLIGRPKEPVDLSIDGRPAGPPSFDKSKVNITESLTYRLKFWQF